MKIQITGASGAGKTYLGKVLAEKTNSKYIDTDDILWVWDTNVQPYTIPISENDACKKLKFILNSSDRIVASGLFYPWSESLINEFDLLIVLETEKEIRKKRIIEREKTLYGNRYEEGGDMHEQFNSYLDWAMKYDESGDLLGSKKETSKWERKFKCPVIHINGAKSLKKKINIILKKINKYDIK